MTRHIRHRTNRQLSVTAMILAVIGVSCGGDSNPASPSGPVSVDAIRVAPGGTDVQSSGPLSVDAIRVAPESTGVQSSTYFVFEAVGSFPSGTTFSWLFGDGDSASGRQASHVYRDGGAHTVSLTATASGDAVSMTKAVSVRSLVGRWVGTITGHTNLPPERPIPIKGFELTVYDVPTTSGFGLLDAVWADDAGCRVRHGTHQGAGILMQNLGPPESPGGSEVRVSFGIEGFYCNDSIDFYLGGVADRAFNVVEGSCGGVLNPNCPHVATLTATRLLSVTLGNGHPTQRRRHMRSRNDPSPLITTTVGREVSSAGHGGRMDRCG